MYRTGNVPLLTIGLVFMKSTDFLRVTDCDGLMDFHLLWGRRKKVSQFIVFFCQGY